MTAVSSERAAFVRAICENPACDTVRLVFADWLEENREERLAEYMRAVGDECWLAFAGAYDVFRNQLMELVPDMRVGGFGCNTQERDQPYWRFGLDHGRQAMFFYSRGFVSHIELPCASFMAHAGELFREHPITSVKLTDRTPLELPTVFQGRHVRPAPLWEWYGTVNWDYTDFYGLPQELWTHSNFDIVTNQNFREFGSEQLAQQWLSNLCITYGRSLANLPPLTGV